jgi:hypothetical protein
MPAAANAAVATRLAPAKTASGTPARSYVKTVTRASAWGLRDPAWAAIAAAIATAATVVSFIRRLPPPREAESRRQKPQEP